MTIRYCLSFAAKSSATYGEIQYDEKKVHMIMTIYIYVYIYMTIRSYDYA